MITEMRRNIHFILHLFAKWFTLYLTVLVLMHLPGHIQCLNCAVLYVNQGMVWVSNSFDRCSEELDFLFSSC